MPKSLRHKETRASIDAQSNQDWFPDWIEYYFSMALTCSSSKCEDSAFVVGRGRVDYDGPETDTLSDYFEPRYIFPMPIVIDRPSNCPEELDRLIGNCESLLLSDPSAAAGRLRVALEILLNILGIQKRQRTSKGYMPLDLHKRIEILKTRSPDLVPLVFALKLLGNTGSHEAQVSRSEMLDAMEVFEHLLKEILDKRSRAVLGLAKRITSKHRKR